MAIKLKPCPFCGAAAQFFEERIFIMGNASLIGVKCTKCGGAYMTSDKDKCPNDVFKSWNQRAGEVTIKAEKLRANIELTELLFGRADNG